MLSYDAIQDPLRDLPIEISTLVWNSIECTPELFSKLRIVSRFVNQLVLTNCNLREIQVRLLQVTVKRGTAEIDLINIQDISTFFASLRKIPQSPSLPNSLQSHP
jgi:hypothetical protein